MRKLKKQIKHDQPVKPMWQAADFGLNSKSLLDVESYPYPMRGRQTPAGRQSAITR
jgi:hypothetical protein